MAAIKNMLCIPASGTGAAQLFEREANINAFSDLRLVLEDDKEHAVQINSFSFQKRLFQ